MAISFNPKYDIGDSFEGVLSDGIHRTFRINGITAYMNNDLIPHIGYFLEDIDSNNTEYDVSEDEIDDIIIGSLLNIEFDEYSVTYEEYSSIGAETETNTDIIYVPKDKDIKDYDVYLRTRINNHFEFTNSGTVERKEFKILSYEKKN